MAQRTSVPASDFIIVQKSGKNDSLGRKNFFPGQGEKIIENILKIFVKIFGGMKNIYYLCSVNRWSSESHQACLNGRVVKEMDVVKLKEQARSTGDETNKKFNNLLLTI